MFFGLLALQVKQEMFDWKDFINLAQELISNHNTNYSEALYRTVISRSYYGIFKQVEDYLDGLNVSLPDMDNKGRRFGSHEKLIRFLRSHNNSQVRGFGDKLNNLKRKRKKADYIATENISKAEADEAIRDAFDLSNRWDVNIKGII